MDAKGLNSEDFVSKCNRKYTVGDGSEPKKEVDKDDESYHYTQDFMNYLKLMNSCYKIDEYEEQGIMDTFTFNHESYVVPTDKIAEDNAENNDVNTENNDVNTENTDAKTELAINVEINSFAEQNNTGAIGLVILNSANFKEGVTNSPEEIAIIDKILKEQNPNVIDQDREKLINALEEGKLAFGFNGLLEENTLRNHEELLSLTPQDIDLLLKYADKTAGIKNNDELLVEEVNLRREYFQNHRIVVPESQIENINEVLSDKAGTGNADVQNLITTSHTTVTLGAQQWTSPSRWNSYYSAKETLSELNNNRIGFTTVRDKGVNPYKNKGELVSDVDRALAEHASNVASDLSTTGACFTGFKHSLLTAGVIKNYGVIRDENGNITTPRNAVGWFQERPEMFTEIKYVKDDDGVYRKINSTDLYDLPAGYIILYCPEEGEEFAKEAGHACITNGNAQAYADHTDRLHWEDFKKGEHGTFHVFSLNDDNWEYSATTQKLEYTGPVTSNIEKDDRYIANIEYKEKNSNSLAFQNSLVENKEILMQTLNITEEQYEHYKALAQAISVVETQAGSSGETKVLDALENIKFVNEIATKKYGALSAGMTQIKASILSPTEKNILLSLGITTDDVNDLDDPAVSAVATIVHINHLEKDYSRYLSNDNIGIIIDKSTLNESDVQKLEKFIQTLTTEEQWNNLLFVKEVLKGNATASTEDEKNLVEGAKIFVNSYVEKLTKDEYIAARWNGKTRTKPSDVTKTKQLNLYYDNMLQVYIDRTRIKILNGEEVEFKPAMMSQPANYGYIGAVTYLSSKY